MIDSAMIEEMLYTNPLSLLVIKDKQTIDYLNNLLPYSTAFEIECDMSSVYDVESFGAIPDIMSVNNDTHEQRYRIPNGLRGIICLYNISYQLKLNSLLNPLSSIHYHVDCTDCFDKISKIIYNSENIEYILSELDTWLEGDKAYTRRIGAWFKLNMLSTVEFRLGEMTFEYPRLLKRVLHVNRIVKKFKDMIPNLQEPQFIEPDTDMILRYYKIAISSNKEAYNKIIALNKELEKISTNKTQSITSQVESLKSMYRNRLHKIE